LAVLLSFDGSDESGECVSGVGTSGEVVAGGPVSFLLVDVLLDPVLLDDPVLGNSLCENLGFVENLSPVVDGSEVIIHTGAGGHGIVESGGELGVVVNGLDKVTSGEVVDKVLSVGDDVLTAVVASLNFLKVVVSGEAEDHTSNEVGDGEGGHAEVVDTVHGGVVRLNGTNSNGGEVSSGETGHPVLLGSPVGLIGSNVGLDSVVVEGGVLGNGLGELCGVSEDGSPLLDGGEIVTHVLAAVESLGDLKHNNTELEDALDHVVPAVLGDLSESELDLIVHQVATGVAGLDFLKVVFTGHTVKESTKELGNSSSRDWEGKSN